MASAATMSSGANAPDSFFMVPPSRWWSAAPIPDPEAERRRQRIILAGDVPSPVNPPAGCRFHTRCWLRKRLGDPERCVGEDPVLQESSPGHGVACHFADKVDASREQLQAVGNDP